MYKIFRNVHLGLGLAVTPFLFIYAFSALIFSLPFLGDKAVDSSVKTFQLVTYSGDPTNLLTVLATEHGVRGDLKSSVINENGRVELLISRPGSYYEVTVDSKTLFVTINENTQSVDQFIKALHVSNGFDSVNAAEKWWGLAVILVAIMIAGIVVTGVVLWSYNRKERRSGLAFLGLSLAYCTIVLAVLRFG